MHRVVSMLFLLIVASLVDFAICRFVELLSFLFVVIPKNRRIRRESDYHTVVAHRVKKRVTHLDNDGGIYRYEWEANGRRYRRFFRFSTYPDTEMVLYYRKNPLGAVDSESKLGIFEYGVELFLILLPLCSAIALRWMSIM